MIALVAAAHAGLVAAAHHGRVEGEGIGWSSTYAVDEFVEVPLAVSLDPGELVRIEGASPVWEGGRLVAVLPTELEVRLSARQPSRAPLRPPIALEPAATQQISLDGLRYVPDEELGLVTHIGWRGPRDMTSGERRAALKRVSEAWSHSHGASVMRVDRAWPDGLPGEVGPAGRVSLAVTAGSVAVALGVLLGLLAAYRALEAFARRERIATFFAEAERDRAG